MEENYEEGAVNIDGSTDSPATALLNKGRYVGNPTEVTEFVSKQGNQCVKISLEVEGYDIEDVIIIKLKWNMIRLRNFLYSIGMRRSSGYKIHIEEINQNLKKVKVDVVIGKDQEGGERNEVKHYSSIDEEEAPVTGVPPETTEAKPSETEKERPKEETKPQEEEDDL